MKGTQKVKGEGWKAGKLKGEIYKTVAGGRKNGKRQTESLMTRKLEFYSGPNDKNGAVRFIDIVQIHFL